MKTEGERGVFFFVCWVWCRVVSLSASSTTLYAPDSSVGVVRRVGRRSRSRHECVIKPACAQRLRTFTLGKWALVRSLCCPAGRCFANACMSALCFLRLPTTAVSVPREKGFVVLSALLIDDRTDLCVYVCTTRAGAYHYTLHHCVAQSFPPVSGCDRVCYFAVFYGSTKMLRKMSVFWQHLIGNFDSQLSAPIKRVHDKVKLSKQSTSMQTILLFMLLHFS